MQRQAGRGDWIRTSDPLNPIQVRYRTAPRPDRPETLSLNATPVNGHRIPAQRIDYITKLGTDLFDQPGKSPGSLWRDLQLHLLRP